MSEISTLAPNNVFRYFDEISAIPRSSRNNEKISAYLIQFAKDHDLEYYTDEKGNVVIYKDATPGYETAEPVMIQGHMDMVAAVVEGAEHDFTKDPLDLYVDGDFVKAKNTTLGADDGIAMAMALAVLESDEIPHPALEVVCTVDEEIGMLGAGALDGSKLHARRILNLDSEEEGVLTVGCAGAVDADVTIPTPREMVKGIRYRFTVDGLLGGHSGNDINLERANAINVAGRVLMEASDNAHFNLVSLTGGAVTNAICVKVSGDIIVDENDLTAFERSIRESALRVKEEYRASDPGLRITAEKSGETEEMAIDDASQKKVLGYLETMLTGVQNYSVELEGLVETSLSTGVIRLDGDEMLTRAMIRSSVNSRKDNLARRVAVLANAFGGDCKLSGEYGAWEFKSDSELLDICVAAFEQHYGREPEIGAVHAGVECGKWAEKLGEIDAVSFGPDMMEVHSTNERLSISSTARTWEYLKAILAACR